MKILFIDDDPDDTELFCEAVAYLNNSEFIHGLKKPVECIAVNDAFKAIELLSDSGANPDYIFLDINMPRMGGKECLRTLKATPNFRHIPVIMFSTTCRPADEKEFRALGAIACLKKPNGFKDLTKLLSKYVYKFL